MSVVIAPAEDLNRAPGETETRGLRNLLQHDLATRLHLEQQRLHREEEMSRAKRCADAVQECVASTEKVQQDLKAAIRVIEKLLVTTQSALYVHDRHSEIAETISSTLRAKSTFGTMISLSTNILHNMRSYITPLESHTCMGSNENHAYNIMRSKLQRHSRSHTWRSALELSLVLFQTGNECSIRFVGFPPKS